MTRTEDIIRDIHPTDLLHEEDTVVEEFDSKEDFIEYIRQHPREEFDLDIFFENIKNPNIDKEHVEQVRNTVRNNLIKRGIITGVIYEGYKYDIEGDIVDYAELATGNPKCMLKPVKKYDKYFYELYVNMSIPWVVQDDEIVDGAIRLAETIRALEELHIEIKINVVMFSRGMFTNDKNYLFIMPLMSHLDYKDVNSIVPFVDSIMFRTAMWTAMRNAGDTVESLGRATKLTNTVNLWELDEEELARGILVDLGLED